jgi:hypothetical protein
MTRRRIAFWFAVHEIVMGLALLPTVVAAHWLVTRPAVRDASAHMRGPLGVLMTRAIDFVTHG